MTGKTSDNHRLDLAEIHLIFADGRRQEIELERRLQALIGKLLEMRGEIKDPHTCELVLHLGESRGKDVVKARVEKRY